MKILKLFLLKRLKSSYSGFRIFYEAGKILAQKGIWDKLSDLEPLMLDIQAKVNISGSVESQLLILLQKG